MESYLGKVLGAGLGVIYTTLPTPHWPENSVIWLQKLQRRVGNVCLGGKEDEFGGLSLSQEPC